MSGIVKWIVDDDGRVTINEVAQAAAPRVALGVNKELPLAMLFHLDWFADVSAPANLLDVAPGLVLGHLEQLLPDLANFLPDVDLSSPQGLLRLFAEGGQELLGPLPEGAVPADSVPVRRGPTVEIGHHPSIVVIHMAGPAPGDSARSLRFRIGVVHSVEGEFDIGKDTRVGDGSDGSVDHASTLEVSGSVDNALFLTNNVHLSWGSIGFSFYIRPMCSGVSWCAWKAEKGVKGDLHRHRISLS